jgi:non-ribosomal peptide synthetase component F
VWNFTATSVGQVATALVQTFRNHQITVPDVGSLKAELIAVRLRESAPGVTRLDHHRGGHDDQAVAIGMACHILIGRAKWGAGSGFVQFMKNQITDRPAEKPLIPRSAAREPARRRCEHRWRQGADPTCVWCGDSKTA